MPPRDDFINAHLDEMAKTAEANEFCYGDDNGREDADLHNAIINPVDYPIDESIMAPIRKKYRDRRKAQGE